MRRLRARRAITWGLAAHLVALGAAAAIWPSVGAWLGRPAGSWPGHGDGGANLDRLGVYGTVPEFTLDERSGRAVSRRDLLGKVWLANFIYTQCGDTCPLQTAELARLQAEFAAAGDFRLVSITVDPERDTPAALAAYAEKYGADPARWWFLTGEKRAIYRLAKDGFRLGVVDPHDPAGQTAGWLRLVSPAPAWATHGSQGLVMHSSRLVLVDRAARIRAYHQLEPESVERLRRNLRAVLREQ
ncbi:MAG: SCO family protein [Candidatus Rokuibacteriota bacterium]